MGKRRVLGYVALAAALVSLVGLAAPVSAATTSRWAGWAPLAGSGGAFTTTMTLAEHPLIVADVTSDSRAGQVGVISGASIWLAQGTDVGAKYGSSQGQSYLNLRPRADTPTTPSLTTYSFRTPTPSSGWTFVLGDIDADQVQVRAIGPNGVALTAAQLGLHTGFNYCAPGIVGKPSCTGSATDVPTWNPATMTLTGNTAASDTSGAAAWFEPTAPISSLSFSYAQRSGLPVYQTWFASLARDITGAVTDAGAPIAGATLTLTDATGAIVGTTTSLIDGSYAFPGFVATAGYTVSITPPAGKIAASAISVPVDLTTTDAVADFAVRDIVPVAVSGVVRDTDNQPVAGAIVTVDGLPPVTTGPDGRYQFDTVPVGTHPVTVTPPAGFTLDSGPTDVTVPIGSQVPIALPDTVLAANPDVAGTVRAGGIGVAGVVVTRAGPGGTATTVTAADGSYRFPRLGAGAYTVSIAAPPEFSVVGAASLPVTVAAADISGVDFALARAGSVSGVVADAGGSAVVGATVTVVGPGGTSILTTDAAGGFAAGSLVPGSYTVTLTVPTGYVAAGPLTRTITITAAGETLVDQNFAVAAVTVDPGTAAPAGELAYSGTGDYVSVLYIIALVLLAIGGGLAYIVVRNRRGK